MLSDRRKFVKRAGTMSLAALAWTAGLITPEMLEAGEFDQAFEIKSPDQVIDFLAGRLKIQTTDNIQIDAPEIAEDGAIVPITIISSLDDAHSVAIIAEKNPIPLIGRFILEKDAEAFIQARIKMAETGHIVVLVKAQNQLFSAKRFVQVTVGGCGS
jgi:sulfur-oxidizing protein SoxY